MRPQGGRDRGYDQHRPTVKRVIVRCTKGQHCSHPPANGPRADLSDINVDNPSHPTTNPDSAVLSELPTPAPGYGPGPPNLTIPDINDSYAHNDDQHCCSLSAHLGRNRAQGGHLSDITDINHQPGQEG